MSPVHRLIVFVLSLSVVGLLGVAAIGFVLAMLVVLEGKLLQFAVACAVGIAGCVTAWLLGKGVTAYKKRAYDLAIAECSAAVRANPEPPLHHNNRGNACFSKRQYAWAIAHFDAAILFAPMLPEPYVGRVQAYGAIGELDRVIADYTAAIEANPNDALAYCARATAFNMLGQPERSIPDATEAIRLAPNVYLGFDARGFGHLQRGALRALKRLGHTAAEARAEYEQAVADFTEAIRLRAEASDCYHGRAMAHRALGNHSEAAADQAMAVELQRNERARA